MLREIIALLTELKNTVYAYLKSISEGYAKNSILLNEINENIKKNTEQLIKIFHLLSRIAGKTDEAEKGR